MNDYPENRRRGYDLEDGQGIAYFLPVCPDCGRYVKMDDSILWNEETGFKDQPNATCSIHGRIKIESEGIILKR